MLNAAIVPMLIALQGPIQRPIDSMKRIQSVDQAYLILLQAEDFAEGPVGYAGQTPPEHFALAYLVNHPTGKQFLVRLLESGSIQSKLYAICGLYFLDPSLFNDQIMKYRSDKTKVPVQQGCIGSFSPVAKVIRSTQPGLPRIVLMHPHEPLAEAQKRALKGVGSFQWDISGGGIPANIFQLGNH
jgi:hypothetical protein